MKAIPRIKDHAIIAIIALACALPLSSQGGGSSLTPVDGLDNWKYGLDLSTYSPGKYNLVVEGKDKAGNATRAGADSSPRKYRRRPGRVILIGEARRMKATKTGRPAKPRPGRVDLARLYVVEGRAVRDVAAALGVSKDIVYRALKEYGLKRRPNAKRSKLRPQSLGVIRGKIEALGYTRAAVALGVNVTTLRRFIAAREDK